MDHSDQLFLLIDQMSNQIDFDSGFKVEANHVLNVANAEDIPKGRSTEAMACALAFYASRRLGVSITYQEVIDAYPSEVDRKDIRRIVHALHEAMMRYEEQEAFEE